MMNNKKSFMDRLNERVRKKAENIPMPGTAEAALAEKKARESISGNVEKINELAEDLVKINNERIDSISEAIKALNLPPEVSKNYQKVLSSVEEIHSNVKDMKAISSNVAEQAVQGFKPVITELDEEAIRIKKQMLDSVKNQDGANKEPAFISNMKKDTNSVAVESAKEIKNEEPKEIPKLLTRANVAPLEKNLKTKVFGQDEVIEEVVGVLKSALVNLKVNNKKPAGSYFFAGPSGVGKTELARAMAETLGVPLLVLNMGEYSLEHEVSKLLGSPPGYAGSDEPGVIPRFIEKNPNGIILFDEVEKAHENADNILLSIMDQGVCQDNKGNNVYFKETIVICTSNLGGKVEYNTQMTQEEKNEFRMEHIKARIRPEIIGRYDAIFHFHSLNNEVYMKIIDKFLGTIAKSAKQEHELNLKFSDSLREMIAQKSYDPALGGRPASKFIEKVLVAPIADLLLRDDFEAVREANPELLLDINKDNNVVLKGKNRKVIAVADNTKQVIERLEKSRFSDKKKLGLENEKPNYSNMVPPENVQPTQKINLLNKPVLQTAQEEIAKKSRRPKLA